MNGSIEYLQSSLEKAITVPIKFTEIHIQYIIKIIYSSFRNSTSNILSKFDVLMLIAVYILMRPKMRLVRSTCVRLSLQLTCACARARARDAPLQDKRLRFLEKMYLLSRARAGARLKVLFHVEAPV